MHTGERPFQCDMCEMKFVTKGMSIKRNITHLVQKEVTQLIKKNLVECQAGIQTLHVSVFQPKCNVTRQNIPK